MSISYRDERLDYLKSKMVKLDELEKTEKRAKGYAFLGTYAVAIVVLLALVPYMTPQLFGFYALALAFVRIAVWKIVNRRYVLDPLKKWNDECEKSNKTA